ncbi:MAG: 2-oxoacid ferredoxin oxidoreductase [bacterium]|nr:MAG: 2-oxoacid ferredoxin oxidoreductase [bacterium]
MSRNPFDAGPGEISWCPGCGNFSILDTLKEALAGVGLRPEQLVVVSGIGQAGKTPHYMKCNVFNGLHGRAIPLATGVKAANPSLTVIAEGGDGDMYGEGGNHFIHAVRRNPDITCIVHNNMVYGLTKGQASPTSPTGFVTPLQVHGVTQEPFNPLAVAICLNAPFVARAFAGDRKGTAAVIRAAIGHRGFALVDILQPCVTFNKVNTWQWFQERVERVPDSHDPADRMKALELALGTERLPTGVLYATTSRRTFEESLPPYETSEEPLRGREVDRRELTALIESLR